MQVSKQLVETMHLIARAFEREADEEFISRVRVYLDNSLTGLSGDTQSAFDRACRQIKKALDGLDKAPDKAEWYDYLAAAYAELFLGVSEDPIAPFESVYLGSEKVLFERQYFEVAAFMSDRGFAKPADFYESEDHIAMEWSFLAYLMDCALLASGEGKAEKADEMDALSSQFLAGHLILWNDKACNDFIQSDDSNGFYSGFASIAKAVLSELRLQLD